MPPGQVGELRQPGVAYRTLAGWLTGATLTHCQTYKNGLWACELRRDSGYSAWVVWSASSSEIPITVPAALALTHYRDWQDHSTSLPAQLTITAVPVLLEK